MEKAGISKIECPAFKISLRKPQPKVEIENEEELPDEYVVVKTSFVPDKRAILAALKSGKEISGAKLGYGKSAIIIN